MAGLLRYNPIAIKLDNGNSVRGLEHAAEGECFKVEEVIALLKRVEYLVEKARDSHAALGNADRAYIADETLADIRATIGEDQ